MFEIIHIIDNVGLGGAQAMMFELHYAFDKYYPQNNQQIIYLKDTSFDQVFATSHGSECKLAPNSNWVLKKINNSKNPVVIFHKLASSSFVLLDAIRKKTNSKLIVINHTLYQSSNWRNIKYIDRMIAVSDHMAKKISKWYPNVSCSTIRNSVSASRYESIEAIPFNKKDLFITGRINRICGWKHSNDWVKWCRDVKLPATMVHEYIGSKPRGGSHVRDKVGKGRNIVKMMGGISDFKQKISIVKNWDVFLYETNRNEGISMAILESLACGVPVVCSNHYGNKEIIEEGVNGYVFKDRGHAQSILKDLINNPSKLKKLKSSTKKHFEENLDAKHMVKKYMEIIEEVAGSKSKKVKSKSKPKEKPKAKNKDIPEKRSLKERISQQSNKNKFTIITSGYNKEKYLKEWAESIVLQKYRPLQVVFADDQSTDGTMELMPYIKKLFFDAGIDFTIVENPKRLYCGGSYHNIVDYIEGSYAGVLDADDMLAEGSVDHVVDLYKSNPTVHWIYTQFLWCNEQMKKGRKGLNSAPRKRESLLDLGDRGVHGIGSGWRTFSNKIKRPDKLFGRHLTCAVDKNMGYRLEEAGPGLFTNKICYHHRGHPIGSTDSVSSTKHAMKMWKQVIKEAHSRRKKYKKRPFSIKEINE